MEMEINQMAELEIEEKPGQRINHSPMGGDFNPEQKTDEMPRSNEEPVDTCQDTVVVTDVNTEKQAHLKAISSEVDQKPMETCQESVVESDVNPEKQIANPGVIYRCKKCRQMVATQEYVVAHEVGGGFELSCKIHKRCPRKDDTKPECMGIFVEPMKWMQYVEEGYVSQKLFCMGCKARLGQFNWAGMKCSCGAWVIPAFQLIKSKIDECSM